MSHAHPWDLNPVLKQERLVTLAHVAVATRNRAFAEADRAAGDTNWGLACKAHERLMYALGSLAASGEHPWLTVIRDGLYVMPLVEDVPVRLFRGAADRPASRHLEAVRLEHERAQPARPQMAFDFMGGAGEDGPWYWLMAMETGPDGMVSRVVFFQANDAGETRHPWTCPLEAAQPEEQVRPVVAAPAAAPVVEAAAPVVEAPAPEAPPRRGHRHSPRPSLRPAQQRQEALWGALGAE